MQKAEVNGSSYDASGVKFARAYDNECVTFKLSGTTWSTLAKGCAALNSNKLNLRYNAAKNSLIRARARYLKHSFLLSFSLSLSLSQWLEA